MTRGILIALLVMVLPGVPGGGAPGWVVFAAPKKKAKPKKKATPTETTKPDKDDDDKDKDEPATPPGGTPATAPTVTPTTTQGGGGSGSGTGGGSAAGTPAKDVPKDKDKDKDKDQDKPATAKSDEEPPPAKDVDVDSLRQEYLSLRDELFKSRARANAVASQLYSTRVQIKFNWASARHYGVAKASIRLDGATVFEDASGAIANDDGVRFSGYVAPGRHLVTFHVEATGKDDDSFTSATEAQIVVKAVANKDLMVSGKGHDSGDIAYQWKRSEKGSYGLGIDVSVKTAAQGAKK